MRAEAVYAVFVSFQFQAPDQPDAEIVEAHQALLDRLPRLNTAVSLKRRSEHAFFLVFPAQQDIDAYLESPEFFRFQSSEGCYDAFVKVFDLMASTGSFFFDLPAAAAVQQLETPAVLPA